jgi:hypothetical protein
LKAMMIKRTYMPGTAGGSPKEPKEAGLFKYLWTDPDTLGLAAALTIFGYFGYWLAAKFYEYERKIYHSLIWFIINYIYS